MKKILLIALMAPCFALGKGAIDPSITQDNFKATLCVPYYTDSVRPSTTYTNKLKGLFLADEKAARNCITTGYSLVNDWKVAVYSCYKTGFKVKDPNLLGKYELNHQVPLGLGGHPMSIDNLFLQPMDKARTTDVLETRTMRDLCRGKLTLKKAQSIFLEMSDE